MTASPAVATFSFEGAAIRTLVVDDEPWWVATDVAGVLDLGNPRTSLALLDDDERGVHSVDTPGGLQQMVTLNEPGLYSLILRSRKPEAKAFKRWVTHEVLPTLRQTGRYEVPGAAPELDTAEATEELKLLELARSLGGLTPAETRHLSRQVMAKAGKVAEPPEPETPEQATLLWIHRRYTPGQELSLAEMFRGLDGRAWVRRIADLEPVVIQLVAAGHLRAIPRPTERRRGRPPSPRFEVLTRSDRPILTVVSGRGMAS
ncbi:Bro-N domain-containing protein [Parafrankia sp. FMc2]|uniref:BRO-N domain-containing protein n=1 Tax=Parafrankia sp. FMc2 TaxID=3233196 RepID=UPI0034D43F4F